MSGAGHNSGGAVAADRLRHHVERIERIEEERSGLADDVKAIYAGAKSEGFDVKVLREVVRRRKQDQAALQERDALIELYMSALGDLATTPLGAAAIDRVSGRA